jgi:hypothetical protein
MNKKGSFFSQKFVNTLKMKYLSFAELSLSFLMGDNIINVIVWERTEYGTSKV